MPLEFALNTLNTKDKLWQCFLKLIRRICVANLLNPPPFFYKPQFYKPQSQKNIIKALFAKIRIFALISAIFCSGFAFAEESGFFLGANYGYGGFKQVASGSISVSGITATDKETIKADSFSAGFLLGYKYFFNPYVGLRFYVGLDVYVPEFKFEGTKEWAVLLNYGGNFDMLVNFIAQQKVDFGLFVGVGIGGNWWISKDIEEAKRDAKNLGIKIKNNTFDIALNAGLRVNIARRHGVELGVRVPFEPATLLNEMREANGVSVNIKMEYVHIYNVFARYTFMF